MKERNWLLLIMVTICICVAVVLLSISLPESLASVKGVITDKYMLSDGGVPIYYFVLDNSTYVRVSTSDYYDYKIGDYYEKRIL